MYLLNITPYKKCIALKTMSAQWPYHKLFMNKMLKIQPNIDQGCRYIIQQLKTIKITNVIINHYWKYF